MSEYSTEDLLSDRELPEVEAEEREESSSETETEEQTTGEESKSEEAESESEKADKEEEPKDDDSTPESKASETAEEEQPWTYKAVKDERSKRQAAEQRAKELEEKLQQFNGEEKKQPEKPDWFNDPDAAARQQEQAIERKLFEQRAVIGQELMRDQHDDFDEMETKFFQMLEENPHLGDGMRSAANPAKYAYETAKKAMEAEALKDVDGYKAKLEADVRKEVEEKVRAEYEAKLKKQKEKEDAILPTLSGASSKGGLKSDDWSGPTPLEEILK